MFPVLGGPVGGALILKQMLWLRPSLPLAVTAIVLGCQPAADDAPALDDTGDSATAPHLSLAWSTQVDESLSWNGPPGVVVGDYLILDAHAGSVGDGNSDQILALDTATGAIVWELGTALLGGSRVVPADETTVVFTTYHATNSEAWGIFRVEASSGSEVWSYDVNSGYGPGLTEAPAVGGSIVVGGHRQNGINDEDLLALRLDGGIYEWGCDDCFGARGAPGIEGDLALLPSDNGLEARAIETGEVGWAYESDEGSLIVGSPATTTAMVCFAATDEYGTAVHCLDLATGNAVFDALFAGEYATSLTVIGDGLYLVTEAEDGESSLSYIDQFSGEFTATLRSEGAVQGTPSAGDDGHIVFGTDSSICAVAEATLADGWCERPEGIYDLNGPVVVGSRVYVVDDDGTVAAFDITW